MFLKARLGSPETFDRTLDNIFAIQDEIALEVVAKLKVTLLGDVPKVQETDPQAYALFLQGRHVTRAYNVESLEKAEALFQQALVIEPDYAAAWVALGFVYINQANLGLRSYDEGATLGREATTRALAIEPDFAPAHYTLGWISMIQEGDLVTAARHMERAMLLEPGNAAIIQHAANLTAALGRLDEAIMLSEFLIARDPINTDNLNNLCVYCLNAGRWDEAIAAARTALTLSPDSMILQYLIGLSMLGKGEPQLALQAMQREKSLFGMIGLPMVYHALGQVDESDAALASLIEQHKEASYGIAWVFAFRGEADRAFEWLAKAIEEKTPGLKNIVYERLFSNIYSAGCRSWKVSVSHLSNWPRSSSR